MRFAHLSDTHLGYRQYGLYDREKDYYHVFEDIISSLIQEGPDFIIHSGDLFEFSRPPTQALLQVQKGFSALKEAGIPVYALPGNHDTVMRKNALPPQLLFKEFGVKVISHKHPIYYEGDLFLGGVPYVSKYQSDYLVERLQYLDRVSKNCNKRVMILHQGIDKYLPFEYELELAQLPENFDYYALGHVHQRIIDEFGGGVLGYPGSTEIWKMDELGNYLKKGKGYYLVDMDGDQPEVEPVNLQLPREFIKVRVEYSQRKEEIEEIKKQIQTLPLKPVLHITVEGGNFSRSELYEELHEAFASRVLTMRPNFKIESNLEELAPGEGQALDVKTMLQDRLSELESPLVTSLAQSLLKEISEGRLESAQEVCQKFYEEFYDHQKSEDGEL